MELKIYWTDFAKGELRAIFNYYKEKASTNVAKKIALEITEEASKLQKHPEIGQKEDLLENPSRDFKYIICKNYKIIYWVNSDKNQIEIFDVFDTRQNPIKIKRTK